MLQTPARKGPPAFSPQSLMAQYLAGRHAELSETLLGVLRHFRDTTYEYLDDQGRYFVHEFVKHALHLLARPDFQPAPDHLVEFIRLGPTLANLVALSPFGTTDAYLSAMDAGPKRLILLSPLNATEVDRRAIFDADPRLASSWYGAYLQAYRAGLVHEDVAGRLRAHFLEADERLDPVVCGFDGYFAASYLDGEVDRAFKPVLNRVVQRALGPIVLTRPEGPDPRKIAVVSGNWTPAHSVYRIVHAHVKALKDYHLTLIQLGRREADVSLFNEVRMVDVGPSGALDLSSLRNNDFAMAYFPDVGLTPQSVILANLRVAPIQVAGLGHSVSTFGAKIDYFMSGADAELPETPERNYSERLVLLPGSGAIHNIPAYTPTGRPPDESEFWINAPWNAQKVNRALIDSLRRIQERANQPVRFRLFVGHSLARNADYLPFVRELGSLLGTGSIQVCAGLPYAAYMARMEEGAFTLDSYPFGGCNTVADSLHVRRLMICREGDRWPNRIGPQMLRAAGFPELVATTDEEYIDAAVSLINDPAHRAQLQARLDGADLENIVFSSADAHAFARAVEHLLAHHQALQAEGDTSPIRID